MKEDNVWLNANAIVKHINNIYNDEKLDKNLTCSILEQVQLEGNKKVSRKKDYYNLTTLFLDYAEDMAEEQNIMTMQKWIDITDKLISFRNKNVLKDAVKESHKQAIEKAENEYEKFRIKQDREYISNMDEIYKKQKQRRKILVIL